MGTSEKHSRALASRSVEFHEPAEAMAPGRVLRPRDLQAYRACETGTEWLIYFMVVFSPWAFGTTQPWAIWTMNTAGYALGALLLVKAWVRWRKGYRPARWGKNDRLEEGGQFVGAEVLSNGNKLQSLGLNGVGASGVDSTEGEDGGASARASTAGRPLVVHRYKWRKKKRGWEWKMTASFTALTAAILAYCLVSAVNVRSTYQPHTLSFVYATHFIKWLPYSLDDASTWSAFWNYLALASVFLALRDWLPGKTEREQRAAPAESPGSRLNLRMPDRLRRLLWVMAVNGGLLALEGIAQRLEGKGNLLFLLKPSINQQAEAQFGPYAYRGNAAAYFNLLWPVCLGFWWTLQRYHKGGRRHHLLLVCAALMAACPLICSSRAGAVVDFGLLTAGTAFLMFSSLRQTTHSSERGRSESWRAHRQGRHRSRSRGDHHHGSAPVRSVPSAGYLQRTKEMLERVLMPSGRTRPLLLWFCAGALLLGYALGWKALEPRWSQLSKDYAARSDIYRQARPMAVDYPVFGTGPGTFAAAFNLYRIATETYWPAQIHNDWLETRITFGWAGSILIFLAFVAVLLRWFLPGGFHGGRRFVVLTWFALAGCLVHARYDFPFQIYSILLLFLVLCAILSVLTRAVRRPAR